MKRPIHISIERDESQHRSEGRQDPGPWVIFIFLTFAGFPFETTTLEVLVHSQRPKCHDPLSNTQRFCPINREAGVTLEMVEVSQIASSIAHRSTVTLEDRPRIRKKICLPVLLERSIAWIQRNPLIGSLLVAVLLFAISALAVGLTYNMDSRFVSDHVPYDSNGVSSPSVFTSNRCF